MAWSAEIMKNWMPRVLGSMSLRAGLGHIGATASNAAARYLRFVFSTNDKAKIELTNELLRVWVNDALITRAAVSTQLTNVGFDVDLSGWTDADESGATSAWQAGGYMGLTGTGTNAAIRYQQATVVAADQGVQHALRVVIQRGPVTLKVGSSLGGEQYIAATELQTGVHSLTLTPTGNFYVQFESRLERMVLVDSCLVEAAGVMTIPTPWEAADLGSVRYDQSGDVLFVACEGFTQRRIERRNSTSWSVVQYLPEDGPFRPENAGPIAITPSGLTGNIFLTASASLFNESQAPSDDNAGALFSITSEGQTVSANIAAQNTFTNTIRVTGTSTARSFTVSLTGTWTATVTLQRSFDDGASWIDVTTYTVNTTTTYSDGLDNQIVLYRIGVKTGDYGANTVAASLAYPLGSITGVVRVTAFSNATQVSAEVLSALGGTTATDVWAEGAWSDSRGWPTSVALYEGRLGWAGKDTVALSVSDAFAAFDPETEGDSGPMNRTIGSGPVDTINWMLPLQRLILGGQGAEHSVRSTAFDEPLTPTNFNIKPASTQGSSAVNPVKIDSRGVYVQRGGSRVFELTFDPKDYDYSSIDLTQLVPEIGQPRVVRMDAQRQPDTRIHCVRSDGVAAVLVYDKLENVLCWVTVETDGQIEDVIVMPAGLGEEEDAVYYVVARSINGATVRYLEKLAMASECIGETLNNQADSFITFTNTPASTTVSGLSHLVGESVVVWQDGVCPEDADGDPKQFTVSASGAITLDTAATTGIVGLPYQAPWKGSKLGRVLGAHAMIESVALMLAYTHAKGLKYGSSLVESEMDNLPLVNEGAPVDEDTVYESLDTEPITVPGGWSTTSRLCLLASAPRPATVLAAGIKVNING